MKPRPRRGCGCGCLGCLGPLLALLVVGILVMALSVAVFTPWSYFLGGTFHLLPGWSGVGTLHGRPGDYTLYLNLEARPPGRYGRLRVNGTAVLLAPSGEKHVLRITGSFTDKFYGSSTNGRRMELSLRRRIGVLEKDGRPRLELQGVWRDPDLVMNDRGSLARAFLPDGRAWHGAGPGPAGRDTLTVTFRRCGMLDSFRALYGLGKP